MKIAALDVETLDEVVFLEDHTIQLPVALSCVAIGWQHQADRPIKYRVWREPSASAIVEMVVKLEGLLNAGYTVCTANGTYFDFPVLSGLNQNMAERLRNIAWRHSDFTLTAVARYGYPVGLGTLSGTKMTEMHLSDGTVITEFSGALAPRLWREGFQEDVIRYLKQDVASTVQVAKTGIERGFIGWLNKIGGMHAIPLHNKTEHWTVQQVATWPVLEGKPFTLDRALWWLRPRSLE